MMDGFLAKFTGPMGRQQQKDLSDLHGVLWEHDDSVPACRACKASFSTTKRRHHCRGCGGIFCDDCLSKNVTVFGKAEPLDLGCPGCCSGETPGQSVTEKIEAAINRGVPVTVLGTSFPQTKKFPVGETIALQKGSKFEKDTAAGGGGGGDAPISGFFNFINKSRCAVSIKVLNGGSNYLQETPRPSFYLVAPGEAVHAVFAPENKSIDIIILTNNPAAAPDAESYSTSMKASGSWGKTDQFRDVVIWQADCQSRNVLVKYKGMGVCELRQGNSLKRNGLGILTGCVPPTQLNFETNCEQIERVFSSM